jgi:hypothetical protein
MRGMVLATSIALPMVGVLGIVGVNCGSSTSTYVPPDSGGNGSSGAAGSSGSGGGGSSSSGSGGGASSSSSGGSGDDGGAGSGSSGGGASSSGGSEGGSPVTISSIFGTPNQFNEVMMDSFMMFGCYAQAAQDCLTTPGGVCPAPQGTAVPLEQQGLVTHESFQVGGTVGKTYVMTLQANGILEAKYYENGTRFAGDTDPANPNAPNGIDTFYTGGDPVNVENYNVYKITVRNPPAPGAEAGSGTEVAHYYVNSFPKTAIAYENHETFPISWTHDIPVPGGGVIEYLTEDRNCHAVDNCGPGARSVSCANSTTGRRNVPNEPNLVVPMTYLGQMVSSINTITKASQPYHSQIVHLMVTAVREM